MELNLAPFQDYEDELERAKQASTKQEAEMTKTLNKLERQRAERAAKAAEVGLLVE